MKCPECKRERELPDGYIPTMVLKFTFNVIGEFNKEEVEIYQCSSCKNIEVVKSIV